MRLRNILIIGTLFISSLSALAQNPAQWRLTVKMTSPTEGVATVKAMVEPGWHIYGMTMPTGGPAATSLDFSESLGIKVNGKPVTVPEAKSGHDKLFDMKLSWWDNDVVFRQKFKVTSRRDAIVKCTIKYMGCNNQRCSMPLTVKLQRKLPE